MFDFGALPPEIVSAWMYSGAGSGPLMSAAAAWSSLAAELESAGQAAQSVISELAGEQWTGPGAAAMSTAVTPYLTWLHTTAAAAEHASSQAMASAAAFESARAATVPPPVITANRSQLAALVASNFLGQNTPAILATEAHYLAMWVQDSLAMFGYSTASAGTGKLTPMTAAPSTTSVAGAAQAAAATGTGSLNQQLAQLVTGLQTALQSLASPVTASASSPFATAIDQFLGTPLFANAINGGVNTAAWFVCNAIPTAVSLGHTLALAGPASLASDVSAAGGLAAGLGPAAVLAGAAQPAGAALGGAPVLAGLGQASTMGGLSVPATWSAASTAASAETSALSGSGWTAAAEEAAPMHAVPAGMGPMGSAGRDGFGSGTPRYGVRPTVMPKQVYV